MRTKTLLLTAALTAAGALTSMAQVYSVNVVGYVNVAVPQGFSLIANQLDNTPDNTIKTLFPTATTANLTTIYKFDNSVGSFSSERIEGGTWTAGGGTVLNPGEGAFVFAPSAFTATFVGTVRTGTSTLTIPTGFSIVSAVHPQAGALFDAGAPGDGNANLQYGTPQNLETIYQFVNANGSYSSYQWAGSWSDAAGIGPVLKVGEAFFNFNGNAVGPHTWTRSFDVGTGFAP